MFQLCKIYRNYILYVFIPISIIYLYTYIYISYLYTQRQREGEKGTLSATWKHNTEECNIRTLLALESISWKLSLKPTALDMKNAI